MEIGGLMSDAGNVGNGGKVEGLSEHFKVESTQVGDSDGHCISLVAGVLPGLGYECIEMLRLHAKLRELFVQTQAREE
jgi:hypothetical protein